MAHAQQHLAKNATSTGICTASINPDSSLCAQCSNVQVNTITTELPVNILSRETRTNYSVSRPPDVDNLDDKYSIPFALSIQPNMQRNGIAGEINMVNIVITDTFSACKYTSQFIQLAEKRVLKDFTSRRQFESLGLLPLFSTRLGQQ